MVKKISIFILAIIDALILISGLTFFIYSIESQVYFKVFNTQIPGIIFALVVIFLGVRYMKAIARIKNTISDNKVKFSWNNFKKLVK